MAENQDSVIVRELRERNSNELESLLSGKVEDLHAAKFRHALGQLDKTHTLRQLRSDIARIRTVLAEQKQGDKA